MELQIFTIVGCAVFAMAFGALWYGPLFGTLWMEVIGMHRADESQRQAMMRGVWKYYALQFALTLLQVLVLAYVLKGWHTLPGTMAAMAIWLGVVVPTLAGSAMWTADPVRVKWNRFLIQAGYQLVLFVVFGYVLMHWG